MNNSDAKYKVYMHQDVMIRNVQFIENIIKIFKQNLKVGMIGMIGGTCMPETGVIYRAWNIGYGILSGRTAKYAKERCDCGSSRWTFDGNTI